jgi:hypothetical protein
MPPGKRSVMEGPRMIVAGMNVTDFADRVCRSRFRHQNSRWKFTPRDRANAASEIPLAASSSSTSRAIFAFQRFALNSFVDRTLVSMPTTLRQDPVPRAA